MSELKDPGAFQAQQMQDFTGFGTPMKSTSQIEQGCIKEADDGDYVSHDDYSDLLAQRDMAVELLRTALSYWKNYAKGARPILAEADVEHYVIADIDNFLNPSDHEPEQ